MSELSKIAEEFLRLVSGELDPYTKNKGVIVSNETSATLFTPSHIQFAKYGRGPGKMPPIQPIIDWIESSGKIDYGEDVESTAFVIAYSIGKKGTIGYTPNAPNAMDEAITKHLEDFLSKTNEMVTVTLLQEMEGIQYFPKEITYKL